MSTIIKCKTAQTNLKRGEKPLHRFYVIHNGTVRSDTIYSKVSQKSGVPQPLVQTIDQLIAEQKKEEVSHGYRVEMPDESVILTLPGTVESATAEACAKVAPKPVVRILAKGELKTCCQGPDFVVENVTEGPSVNVRSVIDNVSRQPNVLTNGSGIEVHAVGSGLYIPDLADATTGAFVADSEGRVLATARVIESSASVVKCVFDTLDLPEGDYKFCVASRNGLDPALYGVSIGRKNVTVVNASAPEEEES